MKEATNMQIFSDLAAVDVAYYELILLKRQIHASLLFLILKLVFL